MLTIGGATQDIYIVPKQLETLNLKGTSYLALEVDTKIELDTILYSTGGGATNSAVSFSRLGFQTFINCLIGNDLAAHAIIQKLEQENVNTSYVHTTDESQTGRSFIIPSAGGKRTILSFRGANTNLRREHLPLSILKQFDLVYITSLSDAAAHLLLPIALKARELGVKIATNPGGSQLKAGTGAKVLFESLNAIDILILNAQEAELFMGTISKEYLKSGSPIGQKTNNLPPLLHGTSCFSLLDYCATVIAQGPKIVVVTNGADGVYVATQNEILFHPALKIDVINTVGAGDSFGSCFVASIMQGKSVELALMNGMINSGSVLLHHDAKEGLLTQHALERKVHAATQIIQKFSLN
ncbi:MAG TPA: carbohydrate kinase family protein [Candidatus Babeliales bacterium]|nr:carbohydrate kinase family protein [Candidatus Babeliales bacterium]